MGSGRAPVALLKVPAAPAAAGRADGLELHGRRASMLMRVCGVQIWRYVGLRWPRGRKLPRVRGPGRSGTPDSSRPRLRSRALSVGALIQTCAIVLASRGEA